MNTPLFTGPNLAATMMVSFDRKKGRVTFGLGRPGDGSRNLHFGPTGSRDLDCDRRTEYTIIQMMEAITGHKFKPVPSAQADYPVWLRTDHPDFEAYIDKDELPLRDGIYIDWSRDQNGQFMLIVDGTGWWLEEETVTFVRLRETVPQTLWGQNWQILCTHTSNACQMIFDKSNQEQLWTKIRGALEAGQRSICLRD